MLKDLGTGETYYKSYPRVPSSVGNIFTYSESEKGPVFQAVCHLLLLKTAKGKNTHITREHLTNS